MKDYELPQIQIIILGDEVIRTSLLSNGEYGEKYDWEELINEE